MLIICHYVSDLPHVSVDMSGDQVIGLGDISQGDSVSITCNTNGNPAPDVVWYRDGSGEIVSRQETMTISDIRRDQAGTYVCQANNSVGQSDPKKIELQVKCEYAYALLARFKYFK